MNEKPVVLIVENNSSCRDLYKSALSNRGLNVYLAQEATEALNLLRGGLDCAVIISDYELPDLNGFQLMNEASRLSPASTKIMVSSRSRNELPKGSDILNRISRFMTKPINIREFLETVASATRRSQ